MYDNNCSCLCVVDHIGEIHKVLTLPSPPQGAAKAGKIIKTVKNTPPSSPLGLASDMAIGQTISII